MSSTELTPATLLNNSPNQLDPSAITANTNNPITTSPSIVASSSTPAQSSSSNLTTTTVSKPLVKQSNAKKHFNNVLSMSAKRIQKELAEITLDPPPNCTAGPKGDNLYEWISTLFGPANSIYENGIFYLEIHFSSEYPFKPPKVTFKTRIYHCNVNAQGGICLDILKDNWSPALTISKVLLSLCSLLSDCNPHDPLVGSIATQFLNNREEHDRVGREWTRRFAQ